MVDNTNFTVVNGVKIQKGAIKSVKFTENGGKQVRLKNDLVIDIGKSPKPDDAVIMIDYFRKEDDENVYYDDEDVIDCDYNKNFMKLNKIRGK